MLVQLNSKKKTKRNWQLLIVQLNERDEKSKTSVSLVYVQNQFVSSYFAYEI